MNQDQLKVAQRALDFYMEHNREDMTASERAAAQSAYNKLDYQINGDEICSGWSIDDVFSLMHPDEDYELVEHSPEDIEIARGVLLAAERNHDASIGINWDVLRYHLDNAQEAAK